MTRLLSIVALLLTLPGPALAQLDTQQVVDAMADPAFKKALGSCFSQETSPGQLPLVLVVEASGSATLSAVPPGLDEARARCVSAAVELLRFPATGGRFQITLTVPVPASASVPKKTTPEMQQMGWQTAYSKARKQIIGGAIALGAGVQFLLIPGVSFLSTSPIMCDRTLGSYDGYMACRVWLGAGISLTLLATVAMSVGIAFLSKGQKRKQQLLKQSYAIRFTPTPDGDGAALSLHLQF